MRKNFCAAPWAGLSLDPDGLAKICCISSHRVKIDEFQNIQTQSKFKEIRQYFIEDKQHPNCDVCWKRESTSSNQESRRSIYQFDDYFHDLNCDSSFKLEHLDLRWSNTCNLNCVYCSSVFSSKWAELEKISQPFRIFPIVQDHDLANLKMLQMAGGEPLLIKENLEVLQRLSKVNPDVSIEVTTNLTMIQNNAIYNTLKKFKNVTWLVSFEAVDQRFEYIRNGARWEKFYNNLKILSNDFSKIQTNMVYFPLSSLGITDAIKVALEFIVADNIFLVSQFGGHGFDMLGENALQYIKQHTLQQVSKLPKILQTRLEDQIKFTDTKRKQTYLPMYEKFDQYTNQNHRIIFPELYI